MSGWLDDELAGLNSEPPPEGLNQLETGVWREITQVREASARAAIHLPVRAAGLVAALGLGVAGGSFTAAAMAAETDEISAFSVNARFAPSSLLDGH